VFKAGKLNLLLAPHPAAWPYAAVQLLLRMNTVYASTLLTE
jgi:hypothetical protein